MARPTVYDESTALAAVASVVDKGATMGQIAAAMTVSPATVYDWQRRHPEFCEAVQAARATADSVIESNLYAAACSGDLAAVKVWLSNRSPVVTPMTPNDLALEKMYEGLGM
ncbi:MAG: hypothetical protein WCJ13_07985 [Coriobacteriia bacterium]